MSESFVIEQKQADGSYKQLIPLGYSNPSALDNDYFPNPINQRRLTTYSQKGSYSIDRWIVDGLPQISGSGVITLLPTGIQLSAGTFITQKLENPLGDVTTSTVGIVSGSASATYTNSTKTFTIQNDSSSGPCVIKWAKLEIGLVATPYVPKGYGTELVNCMRYYQTSVSLSDYGTTVGNNGAIISSFITTTRICGHGFFIPMRIAPTVTIVDKSGNVGQVTDFVSDEVKTGCTALYVGNTGFLAIGGNFISGRHYVYHYIASADL